MFFFSLAAQKEGRRSKSRVKLQVALSLSLMSYFPAVLLLFAQAATAAQSARPNPGPSFDTLSRQAAAARDANRLDEAVALYRRALKIRPSWDEGWWNLGSITYDQDKYAECAPAFQKLLAIKPELAPGWIMSGLCEYALHNYAGARKSLLRPRG